MGCACGTEQHRGGGRVGAGLTHPSAGSSSARSAESCPTAGARPPARGVPPTLPFRLGFTYPLASGASWIAVTRQRLRARAGSGVGGPSAGLDQLL